MHGLSAQGKGGMVDDHYIHHQFTIVSFITEMSLLSASHSTHDAHSGRAAAAPESPHLAEQLDGPQSSVETSGT